MKRYLLDMGRSELEQWLTEMGEPPYRARQLWQWLYVRLADRFADMSDLPQALRKRLEEEALYPAFRLVEEKVAPGGETRKRLFELPDGERIETVLMLYRERATVCVSTQVGCAIGCPYCATGQGGFRRDLSAGEIVEQVLHFARVLRQAGPEWGAPPAVTNVVFMGMGEPLANYEATWAAVERLHDPLGFNLGARRMTISTAGLVPGILRLAEEPLQVNLAVSLHAATDALRDRLVPLNRRYPLEELLRACRVYTERTHRRVSFEYVLIAGVNDSLAEARRLAARLRGILGHVNLIPLNPIPDSDWRPPERSVVDAFRDVLAKAGIPVSVRLERGTEIAAACGQLRAHAERGPGDDLSARKGRGSGSPARPG
jgi:23S rRNA (adenine2503-C2)-methyltransferase